MSDLAEGSGRGNADVERVVAAARDALTDEMVSRLSATAGDAMELVDQVHRSGLGGAVPALARLVKDGDLERIVQLARMYAAAQDAVTDEMVTRMSEAVGGGLALIDQVQRAGLERAIPALVQLVENGDLQRLVRLARVYSSAEDAVTEEMVGRIAETIGTSLSLLDRLSRGGGERIVAMLERLENTGALEKLATTLPRTLERLDQVHDMLECIERAAVESDKAPRSPGGFGGLWRTVKDPETQDALNFLMLVGKNLRTSCPRGT
jgi:plasmid maintenance system antidote protein VapI